jgi:hypothetical protein
VPVFVDQAGAMDVHDLVDAVAELVAAILDVHGGVGVRHVTAVDVGDAGHEVEVMEGKARGSAPSGVQRQSLWPWLP